MRQIFIISSLLISGLVPVFCQEKLNDSLLIYEYAYFKCANEADRQEILIKKVDLYLKQDITDKRVLFDIERVKIELVSDTVKKKSFLWNAALVFYLNGETEPSVSYLNRYEELSADTSTECYLLSILTNKYRDSGLVKQRIEKLTRRDKIFERLNCFSHVINYERKCLNFYLLSSVLVPGSGTIMNGEVLKGIVSLALAAGSVYGIVSLIEYGLYINAALWGTGVGLKFYTGNIKLTEAAFYRAEGRKKNKLAESCELNLEQILKKYPITLKH